MAMVWVGSCLLSLLGMRNSESGVAMEGKDQSKKKTELKKDLGKDGGF
jgi:hypothetical protein